MNASSIHKEDEIIVTEKKNQNANILEYFLFVCFLFSFI